MDRFLPRNRLIEESSPGSLSLTVPIASIFTSYEPDSILGLNQGFRTTSDGFVVIYTDGSCLSNGNSNAKAGIGVFFGPLNCSNISERLPPMYEQTNNNAEIFAVTTAFRFCKSKSFYNIEIRTDSKFLLNCVTSHLPIWVNNGWTKTNKKPVKNRYELEELYDEIKGCTVRWVHVPAHVDVQGNNYADFLAKMATI